MGDETGMTQARHVSCVGDVRGSYRVLVGTCEGKRQLGRPRHRRMTFKWIFKKSDGEEQRLYWVFAFHNVQAICRLGEGLTAFKAGL